MAQIWDTTTTSTGHVEHDWRWQMRHAVTTADGLARVFDLTDSERAAVAAVSRTGLPLLVTPYFLALADRTRADCPIRRQCVPSSQEEILVPGDRADPLGEQDHEVAPHLVQRYPDRVLMLVTRGCAIHCRFCTRARLVRQGRGFVSLSAIQPALHFIKTHPEIREVILSGGDPIVASSGRIVGLIEAIRTISTVETIRIGTRVPSVLPMRIDDALVAALRRFQPIWFMVHFNHPRELTAQAKQALARLVDAGFPVMSQTVMLKGVNDDASILEQLFRGLVRERVRPYYLLHADVAAGTGHLRTTLATSVEIHAALQGKLSGIALPKLVVDTPGGRGKVVVGPEVVVRRGSGATILRTFRGEEVEVLDPPADRTEQADDPARTGRVGGDNRPRGG